jgi:Anti-sigma-K factor rskA
VPHCDPDVLALRALGEGAGSAADDNHLEQCSRCQSELDQLRAVVATSRSAGDMSGAPLESPPPAVWDRVVATVGIGTPAPAQPRPAVRGDQGRVPDARRRRTAVLLGVAAAVVGVLVGVLGTLLVTGLADEDPDPNVVATAALDPLPDGPPGGTGQARVIPAEDGRRLEVSVSGFDPEPERYYEVWLLDAAGQRLYSLGALDSDLSGSFRVPADVDLAEFPVVDVSAEPYDGNPGHSSVSVTRGTLSV